MPVLGKLSLGTLNPRAQQALAAREAALFGGAVYRPARGAKSGAERVCGSPACAAGWTMPWKKRQRPVFEQEWGCSTRCVTALVEAAVRRELGDSIRPEPEAPHRHRVPLGLVLLAQGWITHPQLQAALGAQRASGRGRIGEWLAQSCGLEEDRITRGLGVQWNCPVLAAEGFSPAAMALVMPKRLIAEFNMIPLRIAGSSLLYLAFAEHRDAALALGVEQMSGLRVESGLLKATEFAAARAGLLAADAAPVSLKLVADRDGLTAGIVRELEAKGPVASRLVRVHQYYWLRMWLESGALGGTGSVPPSAEDVEDRLFLVGNG